MTTISREIDARVAKSILQGRVLTTEPEVIKNVAVTNVSFTDQDGEPWKWEDDSTGSSAGQPYAIANFNLINAYGKKKAIEHYKAEEWQESCNTNLSMRVTPEVGRELRESMFATVVTDYRTVTDDDGKDVEALLVVKAIANTPKSASDKKADFGDIFTEAEVEETEDIRTQ